MTLPPRSAWRRLEREPAARSAFSFLGRAYFSEWSLLSTFPGFLPLFRSFYSLCSLSCSFFFLKGIQRLMLCGFRSQIRGLTLQETRCAIRGRCIASFDVLYQLLLPQQTGSQSDTRPHPEPGPGSPANSRPACARAPQADQQPCPLLFPSQKQSLEYAVHAQALPPTDLRLTAIAVRFEVSRHQCEPCHRADREPSVWLHEHTG